jgi:hypothetical protein
MKPAQEFDVIDDVDQYADEKVAKGCGDDNPYAK